MRPSGDSQKGCNEKSLWKQVLWYFSIPNNCPTRVRLWVVHAGAVKQPSSGSESTSAVAEGTLASPLIVYATKYNPPKKLMSSSNSPYSGALPCLHVFPPPFTDMDKHLAHCRHPKQWGSLLLSVRNSDNIHKSIWKRSSMVQREREKERDNILNIPEDTSVFTLRDLNLLDSSRWFAVKRSAYYSVSDGK